MQYTYLFGFLIYTFITLASFGINIVIVAIVNRPSVVKHPQTISDYFIPGQWEVTTIEVIYLIHMFTVFPIFIIVAKYVSCYLGFDSFRSFTFKSKWRLIGGKSCSLWSLLALVNLSMLSISA